jgi:hypothetical protein
MSQIGGHDWDSWSKLLAEKQAEYTKRMNEMMLGVSRAQLYTSAGTSAVPSDYHPTTLENIAALHTELAINEELERTPIDPLQALSDLKKELANEA